MVDAEADPPRHVTSRDGTRIAYWSVGAGPPLVLVHGTTSNHSTWGALVPHLAHAVTLHLVDRRGRGASGDGDEHDLRREVEDVVAVVDDVAARTGEAVDVLGHSYGGLCAFGVPLRTEHVARLVLYEGWPVPDPSIYTRFEPVMTRVRAALDADDHDEALAAFYRGVVGMPDEQVRQLRGTPWWQQRAAAAATIPREDLVERTCRLVPEDARRLTLPVLLLLGEHSPAVLTAGHEDLAALLPNVGVTVLRGQEHMAHIDDPEQLAAVVLGFVGRDPA